MSNINGTNTFEASNLLYDGNTNYFKEVKTDLDIYEQIKKIVQEGLLQLVIEKTNRFKKYCKKEH